MKNKKPLTWTIVIFWLIWILISFIQEGKINISSIIISLLVIVFFIWGYSKELGLKK